MPKRAPRDRSARPPARRRRMRRFPRQRRCRARRCKCDGIGALRGECERRGKRSAHKQDHRKQPGGVEQRIRVSRHARPDHGCRGHDESCRKHGLRYDAQLRKGEFARNAQALGGRPWRGVDPRGLLPYARGYACERGRARSELGFLTSQGIAKRVRLAVGRFYPPSIGIGSAEGGVGFSSRHFAHNIPLKDSCIIRRARDTRDLTVPTGTSVTAAMSA